MDHKEIRMSEDPRCCGSGTCIIDAEDRCWCGRQWGDQNACQSAPAWATPAVGDSAAESSDLAADARYSPTT